MTLYFNDAFSCFLETNSYNNTWVGDNKGN